MFAFAPDNQDDLPIRDLYTKNHSGAGSWGIAAAQSAYQTLLALRILERAVAKAGKDNVTGEAMYDAMQSTTFTEAELMGALPDYQVRQDGAVPGRQDRGQGADRDATARSSRSATTGCRSPTSPSGERERRGAGGARAAGAA